MKRNYFNLVLVFCLTFAFSSNAFGDSNKFQNASCVQGNLVLEATLGNNPQNLNWVIYNSNGVPYIAGSGYTAQQANTTVVTTINMQYLQAGDHNFTIVNNQGNGMDGGFYRLKYNGNVIATSVGNTFTYSQATTFCFQSSSMSAMDVTPPSSPTNLQVVSTTTNSATISWNASIDTQSPVGYGIVVNGDINSALSTQNTSYTLQNLTPGVNYDVYVIAKDSFGNFSTSASNTITINTAAQNNCAQGNLSLQLNFDANPEDVAWVIVNANDAVIASGNSYSNQTNVTETINTLPNGDYVFVIQDFKGDGNTAYTLSDGNTTIASGNTFPYSESTQFCVGTSNGATLDTVTPSDPTNLAASNITQTSVDLSWTASTDNVGVVLYGIFLNDVYLGDVYANVTSLTVPGLNPNTTYTFKVLARDVVGNISGSNVVTVTTQSAMTTTVLHQGFFETGLDGWTDGGGDCKRIRRSNLSYENDYSMRLRDNSGTASSMTLSNQDITAYDAVELNFFVRARGMESGESLLVKYHDGSGWLTVATFTRNSNFRNNRFYEVNVVLSASNYTFPANAQFRIEANGSDNSDRVFVDQTTLTGYTASNMPTSTSINQVTASNRLANNEIESIDNKIETDNLIDDTVVSKIEVYPNPVKTYFSIKSSQAVTSVKVYNLSGRLEKVFKANNQSQFDVSDLRRGIYFVHVETKENVVVKKLIKE